MSGDTQHAAAPTVRTAAGPVTVGSLLAADVDEAAAFLGTHMSSGVPAAAWRAAVRSPWNDAGPDHGVVLRDGGRLVGVYLVFHARRTVGGTDRLFANLGAWCVLPGYRGQSFLMMRALLRRRDCVLTDLSPSGAVVALNRRFGFTDLDTTTDVLLNAPWVRAAPGARLVHRPRDVEALLDGEQRRIYLDHRESAAARHVVISRGGRSCYVVYRRDRRKRLPLFVSVLHVSDKDLFAECGGLFRRHVLRHHGVPFSLLERRVTGPVGRPLRTIAGRPRMFRGDVRAQDVDYLYGELSAVPW